MERIYTQIRDRAHQIVSRFPPPLFYEDFPRANDLSRQFIMSNTVVAALHGFVAEHLEDDFGHGLVHALKVSVDAGALMIVEAEAAEYPIDFIYRRVLLVQCAGLLHDMKRKQKDHAIGGADFARKILKAYPLLTAEVEDVCQAIRNHEAFKNTVEINTPEGLLVSDCLYDADKFRWGPDNFLYTIWDMIAFYKIPLPKFVERYPNGMKSLEDIKGTFRTRTGKKYGPQFIDMGIAIGEELLEVIQTEFDEYLS
ncbi:HD domain-containing protein [Thermodesulfobacteriota bacterium]